MVKIYQVYQEKRVVHYGYAPRPEKWEIILVEQFADKVAADEKCDELTEHLEGQTSRGRCFVNELSIPKEVVEQALKKTFTSR